MEKDWFQVTTPELILMIIGLNAGYFAQFGKNDFESDKNEVLNNRNETIGPDWSGLRVGLSLSVSLPHKKVTSN